MATAVYSTRAPDSGAYLTRRAVEDRIEELIALLDDLDDDPDTEPSFGSLWDSVAGLPSGAWDEREPNGDEDEPSLGAIERHPTITLAYGLIVDGRAHQLQWGGSGLSDCEVDAGDEGESVDEDGSGEFAGGDLRGADEPEINAEPDPDAWVPA